MSERVVITGIGCISCFGIGHRALIDAIGSEPQRHRADHRASTPQSAVRTRAAMIRDSIRRRSSRRSSSGASTRSAASRSRARACSSTMPACPPDAGGRDDIGIALGTFTAGLDSLVEYLGGLTDHGPTGVPAILFSNTVSNAPASLCAIEFGLRGPNVTFNQREASSLGALVFSVGAIREGRTTAMVTGGADCVEETFFKVHDRFRALSPMRGRPAAAPRRRVRSIATATASF